MSQWRADPEQVVKAKPEWRIGVVVARFNDEICSELLRGFEATCTKAGMSPEQVEVHWVPGAVELPLALQSLGKSGRVHALCGLGAVIRGGTPHFDYVCQGCTSGIQQASLETNIPIAFGVLTTDTVEQALLRSYEFQEKIQ